MSLKNKGKVLVGVTGSIAAFKIAEVVSALVKKGIETQVIMTKSAAFFIGEDTFSSLTGKRVYKELFSPLDAGRIPHVELSREYDLFLIAPATADIIGKISHGIADDFLTTTFLGFSPKKVVIAPAMNTRMYENPFVQENIKKLKRVGYRFIEPGEGLLACKEVGKGRLAPWEDIVKYIESLLFRKNDLAGRKILVTAGPTREAIDPVRFITNRSSGKMGYRIAEVAKERGADVILISGPTYLTPPPGVETIKVESALDMYNAVMEKISWADIFISAAAVSDFRPKEYVDSKIKKGQRDGLTIELVRNPDILKEVSKKRRSNQIIVGFAAETDELLGNAQKKMSEKDLDLIVANKVGDTVDSGFESDTNKVTIVKRNGKTIEYPTLPKEEVADIILSHIVKIEK